MLTLSVKHSPSQIIGGMNLKTHLSLVATSNPHGSEDYSKIKIVEMTQKSTILLYQMGFFVVFNSKVIKKNERE